MNSLQDNEWLIANNVSGSEMEVTNVRRLYNHRFHLKKKYGSAPATIIRRIAKG